MRSDYVLPWLADGGEPTEVDEKCIRNIEYLSRDVALHSRLTKAEVKESIYRLIGHECNHVHAKSHNLTIEGTKEDTCRFAR